MARACDEAGITWIGPPPEAIEAMGSKTRAREIMAEAGVPIVPGSTEVAPDIEAARKQADEAGYPVACKAAGGGGGKGFRVAMTPGRPAGRLRRLGPRRREILQRPARLHRALPRGPAPRRGPGAGRLARQRDPRRRARLLDPAPSPEGDRGGPRPARRRGDARADRQDRHRRGRRGRLPRRGHDRGHAGRRRVLLPRDEHPRPGRALRDRDDQRPRHRPRADPRRGGRAALDLPGRGRPARLVDRVPDQRRERGEEIRPRPGADRAVLPRALGPRRARRLRRRGRRRGDPDVRPDGRQARRLGRRPREGDAPHAAGARRIRLGRPADADPLPQGDPARPSSGPTARPAAT